MDSLEFPEGHGSHGFPQPLPFEQQQDALATPTPISLEHSKLSEASPRERTSRKQLPVRVSAHMYVCQVRVDKADNMLWGLTYTARPRRIELKIHWALTQVASRVVNTDPIDAEGRVCTFIHI